MLFFRFCSFTRFCFNPFAIDACLSFCLSDTAKLNCFSCLYYYRSNALLYAEICFFISCFFAKFARQSDSISSDTFSKVIIFNGETFVNEYFKELFFQFLFRFVCRYAWALALLTCFYY